MHQYKIVVYEYNEDGSVGAMIITHYADDPEKAEQYCNQYGSQYIINDDGTKRKVYKVDLHLLCYKLCSDKTAFFNQFKA